MSKQYYENRQNQNKYVKPDQTNIEDVINKYILDEVPVYGRPEWLDSDGRSLKEVIYRDNHSQKLKDMITDCYNTVSYTHLTLPTILLV